MSVCEIICIWTEMVAVMVLVTLQINVAIEAEVAMDTVFCYFLNSHRVFGDS